MPCRYSIYRCVRTQSSSDIRYKVPLDDLDANICFSRVVSTCLGRQVFIHLSSRRYRRVSRVLCSLGSREIRFRFAMLPCTTHFDYSPPLVRLADLDEDGCLSAEEFRIAFHLISCATQKKIDVPDELPAR